MNVSVVTSVYNGEDYVKESVISIIGQKYKDFEYIIINDGSTDKTGDILSQIKDERIRIIHLEKNIGSANALNIAISHAKGKWIAIQDADDVSLPDRLEEQIKYISSSEGLVALGSLIGCISGKIPITNEQIYNATEYWNTHNLTYEQMWMERLRGCPLCHGSVIFSKEIFLKVGGYNPAYTVPYDMDLWIRMFEEGKIEKIQQILYLYRIDPRSLSHRNWVTTCNEMMVISLHYISNLCFKNMERPLRFSLIGTSHGFLNFNQSVLPHHSEFEIKHYIECSDSTGLINVYHDCYNGILDGILILDGPKAHDVFRFFHSLGMELNKNLFRLHNGSH